MNNSIDFNQQNIEDIKYLDKLLQQTYLAVCSAQDSLSERSKRGKYHLSLCFLTIASQGYIEAKSFYDEKKSIADIRFEGFFEAYRKYKSQFMEFISTQDNIKEQLNEKFDNFKDKSILISSLIRNINY
ncbi:hypothetical protein [Priestia filamentosa]|uniref:hypothetical protein n=1 Tax=Priestia filamentosa TaxID=1402861 RepID=UPI002E1A6397|nr:hypothetical protein [Priestia filamentosa]